MNEWWLIVIPRMLNFTFYLSVDAALAEDWGQWWTLSEWTSPTWSGFTCCRLIFLQSDASSTALKWPDFEFLECYLITALFNLFSGFGITRLLYLFQVPYCAYSESIVITKRHQHKVVSYGDSTATLIVCNHGKNRDSRFRSKVMEWVVIYVAENKVFWLCLDRILLVLTEVWSHSWNAFRAIASIDYVRAWTSYTTN